MRKAVDYDHQRRYAARNDRGSSDMRSTASALTVEPDEVPMSATEVLEANVVAIGKDLSALREEVRTGFARVDRDIDKIESDNKALRDKVDAVHESLRNKIDANHAALDQKIEA